MHETDVEPLDLEPELRGALEAIARGEDDELNEEDAAWARKFFPHLRIPRKGDGLPV